MRLYDVVHFQYRAQRRAKPKEDAPGLWPRTDSGVGTWAKVQIEGMRQSSGIRTGISIDGNVHLCEDLAYGRPMPHSAVFLKSPRCPQSIAGEA
jgi:hypothetical protein